jgi:predicted small lipoprotein YifL
VQSKILGKSGGKEFLAKVNSGAPISGEEMVQYFPPADQEALFDADAKSLLDSATQQIDPTTGQPFIGERLIERAAQMHFGGSAIPIDALASDVNGKLTVKTYGETAGRHYQQALQTMGCN